LPDCTRHYWTLRLAVALACALVGVAAAPWSSALADGDPASDVLASQPLFAPADGGFAQSGLTRLNGLLSSAQRQGAPIRVALIASPADLGSVSELWRRPHSYAQFLGQELSQVYRGTVVVVMPDGDGVYRPPPQPRGVNPIDAAVPRGTAMIPAAVSEVQALAHNAGKHLSLPGAVSAHGTGSALSSVDLGSWLALAAGATLIAAAWAASLRARPARRLRRAR
jgi:hypothetical protein